MKSFSPVLTLSAALIIAFTIIGFFFPTAFGNVAASTYDWVASTFGWVFMLSVFVFDVFLIAIIFTRYGKLKLGRFDEEPEFDTISWIGMLFSGGLGVGIVFWGVAEPMTHYLNPPMVGIEPQSIESARLAMGYTFFHWGVSQWSIFAIAGLIIGLFQFRMKQDGLISTSLESVFGKDYGGKKRYFIDILAIFATVVGIAISLGLGVLQINGGLSQVFGLPKNTLVEIIITIVLAIIFMISATTGLHRGVKFLSNLNIFIAFGLTVFVVILGPTTVIFKAFVTGIGDYLSHFIEYSLRLDPYQIKQNWVEKWTVFYWAWVISWSPFIGAFIARISRGRTIREFVIGVLIVPPMISFLWIAAFGGSAIFMDLYESGQIAQIVAQDNTQAMYAFLHALPIPLITSTATIILIATFLITSADSATYILASMSSGGSLQPKFKIKMFWGVLLALISLALLASGGLKSLQSAAIVAGLPFTIILIIMLMAIIKVLKFEADMVIPIQMPTQRPNQDEVDKIAAELLKQQQEKNSN